MLNWLKFHKVNIILNFVPLLITFILTLIYATFAELKVDFMVMLIPFVLGTQFKRLKIFLKGKL